MQAVSEETVQVLETADVPRITDAYNGFGAPWFKLSLERSAAPFVCHAPLRKSCTEAGLQHNTTCG